MFAQPKLTQKLLDLSPYDIGAWIEGKIGDRFGQLESVAFISGNGIKKPRGILTYPAGSNGLRGTIAQVSSGHATQLTGDGLINLTTELRGPYRRNARWLMNRKTAGAIRLFKDLNGQYMWSFGLTESSPDRLLGYPVEYDENMPDVGAGTLPIAFGDFARGYFIPDWAGLRLLRDPYSAKPHVLFYGYKRVGGDVRDFDAIKLQVVSASL